MGLHDILEFKASEYQSKVRGMSPAELREREICKLRQQYSGAWAAGVGLGAAPLTVGFSLIGSGWAWRKYSIAEQKLAIVQEELRNRGLPLYEERKRDFLIPAAIGIVTLGIGCGSSIAIAASSHLPSHDIAAAAVGHMASHPGAGVDGIFEGAQQQAEQVLAIPGAAQVTHCATDDPAAFATGHDVGVKVASFAMKEVVVETADRVAQRLTESRETLKV
ncbi:hypothetical protein KC315_g6424 [Hortaea werneckii]|nr:hypothetical protein KC315_g6424 [Hortaea werneckii]